MNSNSSLEKENFRSAQQSRSGANTLPPLKETNKFSSWADKNMFDQVDELLLETEEQQYSKKSQSSKQQQQHKHKDSLVLSLSGSLDLDSYEIEDEPSKGGLDKDLSAINGQNAENESDNGSIINDSLDLDNSDDLNKIIQKYETMLNNKQQQQQSSSVVKRTLDESWGVQAKFSNNLKNTSNEDYDDYSEDEDFATDSKEFAHEDDDKLVDEEIDKNSSSLSQDSQYMNELMNQPLRNKAQHDSKTAAAKIIAQLEGSGEYQDDIDEFIRRHIENEEKEEAKIQIQDQNQHQASKESSKSTDAFSSSSNSSSDEVFEEDKRTPKQILLDEMKKIADIFGKYSLNESLIYQPNLQETIAIIQIQIFPIIQKLLINSEEQVQTEGVDALVKLTKDGLDNLVIQNLVSNLVELIMQKADQSEAAKISVLMIVERFADENILLKEDYNKFLDDYLIRIQKGMLFKIKKFLIPTLLAIAKHISYERFEDNIYLTFVKFCSDDIWGVRKVCIEKLQDFVKLIKPQDFQKTAKAVKILEQSLNDNSRWVKNQAFQNFGYIINEVFEKSKSELVDLQVKQQYKSLLQQAWDNYYNPVYIASSEDDQSICQSFMGNQNDDVDKIKYSWAFFLPCALILNGGEQYWHATLKSLYEKLYKDILLNVRKTLASSLTEVTKQLDLTCPETQDFIMRVTTHFLQDIDEIKAKVTPQLCSILALFPITQHSYLLSTLLMEQIGSMEIGRSTKDHKIGLLEQIYGLFLPQTLAELEIHNHLTQIIDKDPAIQHKQRACKLFSSQVIVPLIKSKKYRKTLTAYLDNLRISQNFRSRQLYVLIAKMSYKCDQEIFKKHFAKSLGNDMINEKVRVVQICLAQLCSDVEIGYSKSLDKVRTALSQILQLMQYLKPFESKDHLLYYQEETSTLDQSEENDQREHFEKTVNIRFANYTMLSRSGQLGAGQSEINSTLLALLGGMLGYEKGEEALIKSGGGSAQWQN